MIIGKLRIRDLRKGFANVVPEYFVFAWEERHKKDGATPYVLDAVRVYANMQRAQLVRLGIGVLVMILSWIFLYPRVETASVSTSFQAAFVCFIVLLAGFGAMIWSMSMGRKGARAWRTANDFVDDMNRLYDVLACSPRVLLQFSADQVRQLAVTILVGRAREIRGAQPDGRPTVESMKLMDAFRSKYDLLRDFGLADGGYERYFKLAEEEVNQ